MENLKRKSINSCKFMGHDMDDWQDSQDKKSSICYCKKCKKWVQVIVNPMPNEIDIGGPAVALGCKD